MILCTGIGTTILDAVKDLRPGEQIYKIGRRSNEVYDFTDAPPDCRIILAGGYLAGRNLEQHTPDSLRLTEEENFTKPMSIAQQALAELAAARVCVIGSMSAATGSYDQHYAVAKSMMHRWVLRQKTVAPQQLVVVAPPIIADSGMTRRRTDYPVVLKNRNHCYAIDVARVVVRLLWDEPPRPDNNNRVVFVEPTVKVEGAAC